MLEAIRSEIKKLAEGKVYSELSVGERVMLKAKLTYLKRAFRQATISMRFGEDWGEWAGEGDRGKWYNRLFASYQEKIQFLYDEGLTG